MLFASLFISINKLFFIMHTYPIFSDIFRQRFIKNLSQTKVVHVVLLSNGVSISDYTHNTRYVYLIGLYTLQLLKEGTLSVITNMQ